jgi:hypothetical protein
MVGSSHFVGLSEVVRKGKKQGMRGWQAWESWVLNLGGEPRAPPDEQWVCGTGLGWSIPVCPFPHGWKWSSLTFGNMSETYIIWASFFLLIWKWVPFWESDYIHWSCLRCWMGTEESSATLFLLCPFSNFLAPWPSFPLFSPHTLTYLHSKYCLAKSQPQKSSCTDSV